MDEEDSNDENHPNNDYPDEDNSERSSEGIIEQGCYGDWEDRMEEECEDEEEVYRRYLRRLARR